MTQTISIYALLEPDTDKVGYVGKTNDPVGRIVEHLYTCANGNTQKDLWVRSLQEQGKKPRLVVLEEVAEEQSQEAEKRWVAHYKKMDAPLTNVAFTKKRQRRTTTVAVFPEDAAKLEDLRRQLVVQAAGENRAIADAVAYLLEVLHTPRPV